MYITARHSQDDQTISTPLESNIQVFPDAINVPTKFSLQKNGKKNMFAWEVNASESRIRAL